MVEKNENGCCISAVKLPRTGRVSVSYSGKRCDIKETFLMLCYDLIGSGALPISDVLSCALTASHTMAAVNAHDPINL